MLPDQVEQLKKGITTMSYRKEKTPILEPGLAQVFMVRLLEAIKAPRNHGLTSFIEKNGINGKWLIPNSHHEIRISKLLKIFEKFAIFKVDDFLEEWIKLGEAINEYIKEKQLNQEQKP